MPTTILDIEQHLLLLELQAPFDKRDVQLARRRMAKRWHPDVAPQGRQFEHERHLKAINEAADQLENLAEGSRGGHVSRNAVRASAAAARRERAEAGRRAYEAEQRARAHATERAKHDPFGSRVPKFASASLTLTWAHMVRTTRNCALPLIMRAYASAAFSSG